METCIYCGEKFDSEHSDVSIAGYIISQKGWLCKECLAENAVYNTEIYYSLHSKLEREIYALENIDDLHYESSDQEVFIKRRDALSLEYIDNIPLDDITREQKENLLKSRVKSLEHLTNLRALFLEELKLTNTYVCDNCNKRYSGEGNATFGDHTTSIRCDACQKDADDYYKVIHRNSQEIDHDTEVFNNYSSVLTSLEDEIFILNHYSQYIEENPNTMLYNGEQKKRLYEIRPYEVEYEIKLRKDKLDNL